MYGPQPAHFRSRSTVNVQTMNISLYRLNTGTASSHFCRSACHEPQLHARCNPVSTATCDFHLIIRKRRPSGFLQTGRHIVTLPGFTLNNAIFEVLTTVLNIKVFWDITPCMLVNSYHFLGSTFCLHFQG